jgi:hypothetical protein
MNNSPTTQMIARWAMLRPQKDLIAPPTYLPLICGGSPQLSFQILSPPARSRTTPCPQVPPLPFACDNDSPADKGY